MKAFLPLLLWIAISVSSFGQPTWKVAVGWGTTVVPGTWVPLTATAPAETGPWVLTVRAVSVSGKVSSPTVYHPFGGVYHRVYFLAEATKALEVEARFASGIHEQMTIDLASRRFPGHLIGTWKTNATVRASLTSVLQPQEPVRVTTVPPTEWPTDLLAWGGYSALVVQDPGAVLSPGQLRALRAWLATGGRLVVGTPRPGSGSLANQVGPAPGRGLVHTVPRLEDADWPALLQLEPFGHRPRLGTDVQPRPRPTTQESTPVSWAVGAALAAWAGFMALLLLRRGFSVPIGWALVSSVALLVALSGGFGAWDQGLSTQGQEVVLPGGTGRWASWEIVRRDDRAGIFGWPEASPWVTPADRAAKALPDGVVRFVSDQRCVVEAYLP